MKYISILYVFLFISCMPQKKQTEVESLEDISDIPFTEIDGKQFICDSVIWGLDMETLVNNEFIIIRNTRSDYCYDIYRIDNEHLIKENSFLKRGNGPREAVQSYLFKEENKNMIYLLDFQGKIKKTYGVSLSDINNVYNTDNWEITDFPTFDQSILFTSPIAVNDSIWIFPGGRTDSNHILSKINRKTMKISPLNFTFPEFNLKTDKTIAQLLIYGDAHLLKHPSQNKLLYACKVGRYAEIISLGSDAQIQSHKPIFKVLPEYTISKDYKRHFKDNCLRGMKVCVTEKFIYCLPVLLTKKDLRKNKRYNNFPNNFSDEIYVFDWEGVLKSKYKLDTPVVTITVDEKDSYLYAGTMDESGEFVIRYYNISNKHLNEQNSNTQVSK